MSLGQPNTRDRREVGYVCDEIHFTNRDFGDIVVLIVYLYESIPNLPLSNQIFTFSTSISAEITKKSCFIMKTSFFISKQLLFIQKMPNSSPNSPFLEHNAHCASSNALESTAYSCSARFPSNVPLNLGILCSCAAFYTLPFPLNFWDCHSHKSESL